MFSCTLKYHNPVMSGFDDAKVVRLNIVPKGNGRLLYEHTKLLYEISSGRHPDTIRVPVEESPGRKIKRLCHDYSNHDTAFVCSVRGRNACNL